MTIRHEADSLDGIGTLDLSGDIEDAALFRWWAAHAVRLASVIGDAAGDVARMRALLLLDIYQNGGGLA